ncbi:MAG: hypothetical protein HYZ72_09150 [Deltaproteobacteria bacterium]|nr:hypothetical protein [Deltaproteobacteria bacterium]
MEQTFEQRLREVLAGLPSEDIHAIVAFAQFLYDRRQAEKGSSRAKELSDAEHARILNVLDAVAALSEETGPPVSNRDHDRYLYGED